MLAESVARDFVQRLEEFRQSHGWTRTELAENIGVTRYAIYAWINGIVKPYERTAYEIDDLLKLGIFVHSPEMDKRFKI